VNPKLWVFSGRSNPEFTAAICKNLGCELGRIESTRFSDGELSIEVCENVRGGDIFVVQSTSTPGNDHLMELLITIDALKRASAWRITAVIPYFGYARQDRKLKPRVPITAKLVADIITRAGAGRLLTMDLHSGQIMGFFDIPVDNLEALPVMVNYIVQNYGSGKDITIVSPDVGGVERARRYATKLNNAPIAVIDKRRSAPNHIEEMNVIGDVSGKICVIVDDMVDTAGTLVKAVDKILEAGAKKVIAAISHGVLSGVAVEKLRESKIEEVILTDSIYFTPSKKIDKIKVLSVAPFFAEAISRINRNDSVSSLFI
jgi:ribose-phosphate pyrophosphokinase